MSRFLKYLQADRFGGLEDCKLGPLGPGLNVVYGPNEAGKSTFAALTRGVLFGWEEAHGVRNTYRPPEGDRTGSLVFAESSATDGAAEALTFVSRDEEGVMGDLSVIDDVDQATYDAIFSFSADELRALRASSDVTARLLAAESGTANSPSSAFVEVEQRIAACTARADSTGDSIFSLEMQLEATRARMKEASERNELFIQEHRELRELRTSRAATSERIEAANAELEDLSGWRAELEQVDQLTIRCQEELAELHEEKDGLMADAADAAEGAEGAGPAIDPRLLALDSTDERVLRDRLDEFQEQREKLDRIVDAAKENSATSTAAYEALMEIDEDELKARRSLSKRSLSVVVSLLLPVAFIVAGIPLFVHGRQINSLSFTALGVGLIVFSVLLATAAIVNMFRRPQAGDVLEERKQDAQWVMLQDSKKLAACQADKDRFEEGLMAAFEEAGLAEANGSIRQARTLLKEARAQRAALAAATQRASSIDLRIRTDEKDLAERQTARARICSEAGLPATAPLRDFDALVREKADQRDALLEALESMSERFGELTRELELAKANRELDQLKLEYFQLRTRLRERKHELVTLLIARRLLERSISTWENQSQPEVYDWAGQLLSTITGGRWVGVSTSGTGSLVAVSAEGEQRDPRHLSLGTCQQLYLALRMALLITAHDVGREVPVIADDILVHFDAARRQGAAKALATLAEHRQVIIFTCHKDIAETLTATTPTATNLTL